MRVMAGVVLSGVTALLAVAPPCSAELLAQVSPARDAITARPGVPVARDVIVTNRGDTPVVVHVRLLDWTVDDRGGMRLLPAGTLPATLAGCIRFEPEVFSLAPGASGRVAATLDLPADGPRTRWGILLSEVRPAVAQPTPFGPRAIAELGTTLYLSSVPAERAMPEIVGLEAATAGRDSLTLTVRVRNAGERQFHIIGEVTLEDSTGRSVQTGRLPTGVVLPGREREFTWTCDAPLPPGTYRAMASLDTGQPELLVGEVRLRLPAPPVAPPSPLAQHSPR